MRKTVKNSGQKTSPQEKTTQIGKKRLKQEIKFELNEEVLYRSEFKMHLKWIKAKIIEVLSKVRYRIKIPKAGIRDCHGDQLRKYNENKFLSEIPIPNSEKILNERIILKPRKNVVGQRIINRRNTISLNRGVAPKRRSERLASRDRIDYREKKKCYSINEIL